MVPRLKPITVVRQFGMILVKQCEVLRVLSALHRPHKENNLIDMADRNTV